jgi:hypothetical protein
MTMSFWMKVWYTILGYTLFLCGSILVLYITSVLTHWDLD